MLVELHHKPCSTSALLAHAAKVTSVLVQTTRGGSEVLGQQKVNLRRTNDTKKKKIGGLLRVLDFQRHQMPSFLFPTYPDAV